MTTPDQHTIEEVCGFLKVPAQKLIKTLLYVVDGKPVAALVRGDRELNEIKLKNYFKADEVVLASPEQVTQWTNAPVGFAGPVGFTAGPIVADHELMADTDWIAGANKADTHILHVDLKRDVRLCGPAFHRGRRRLPPLRQAGGLRQGYRSGPRLQTRHQVFHRPQCHLP